MSNNVDNIQELLEKLSKSRDELERYVKDLEELREKVDTIFPSEINYRNKYIIEEKIKASTEFYNSLLRLRQEINRTIKDEIDIRNKISKVVDESKATYDDIRRLAQELDKIQKEKEKNSEE